MTVPQGSGHRILAIVRRHLYVTIHSPTRMIELGFWPIIDLLLWGMITTFLRRSGSELPIPVSFFLGAILLWDLVFRSKNSVALCLLEENHSRNVISVLASPVTPCRANSFREAIINVGLTLPSSSQHFQIFIRSPDGIRSITRSNSLLGSREY